jgi:predicted nuclease of restriction endonuclease-like RecB superfamily
MYPVISQNPELNETGNSFWDQLSHLPGTIESRVPTFDKSLDAYFDQNFAAIIEEWDLVTESDLHRFETRLARVTDEISSLYAGKVIIEARAKKLDNLITSMEKSV